MASGFAMFTRTRISAPSMTATRASRASGSRPGMDRHSNTRQPRDGSPAAAEMFVQRPDVQVHAHRAAWCSRG